MSLRIEYHDLVDTDLEHAWTWYEDRERGLGDHFLDAIRTTVIGRPDGRTPADPSFATTMTRSSSASSLRTASRTPCATGSSTTGSS